MRCFRVLLLIVLLAVLPLGIIFSSFSVLTMMINSNTSISWIYSSFSTAAGDKETPLDDTNGVNPRLTADKDYPPHSVLNQYLLTQSWKASWRKGEFPPLDKFKLTKELVAERVKENVILITFGNHAYMDFIMNWAKHLTDMGLYNILVGAMDVKLLEDLYWKGVPVFLGARDTASDVGWGSSSFSNMARERAVFLQEILQFGYEVLLSDTDVVWVKNPLPYFARYPQADIFTSTDQLEITSRDDRLANWKYVYSAFNVGILHWRPTNTSRYFMEAWKRGLLQDNETWDQQVFNNIIRKKMGPSVAEGRGLVYAFDGNLKLGLLPSSIFCSGQTFFVQALPKQLGLQPYAVHTTFQYGGVFGKRHRLREALLFHDPPEYYNRPGGFLAFNPAIPKSMFQEDSQSIEAHFELVNYQLKNIRTAFAIATVLGRGLILPPLWCRFERLFFPHPGLYTGTLTKPPFVCPLDHVFAVEYMAQTLDEEKFGPTIDFREYSFMDNPSLPNHVKESFLYVDLCDERLHDCHGLTHSGILRFPTNSGEHTFKKVFSSYKDVKVIHFSSMEDAFHGFSKEEDQTRFRNRMNRYASVYCCVNNTPGHILYDMYWDEKQNWKPEPPQDHQ